MIRSAKYTKLKDDTYGARVFDDTPPAINALEKAAMPVPGLGFDDDGVTYGGVPLDQASGAEQLRVSLAIAMACSPTLRDIWIKDGSLLDDDSLEALRQLASEKDYRVWVERVGDGDDGALIIEDGAVRDGAA